MQPIIRSRAPVRISFAGGGTDVSPYTEKHGGAVINAAINRYAYTTLIARDDSKIVLDSLDMSTRIEYKNVNEVKLDGNLDLPKSVILHFKENFPNFFDNWTRGFELHTNSEVPPRSGLGSSASMFASVIGVFNSLAKEYHMNNYEIAELAYYLERKKLKNLGGRQDQYAAVFGGINFIEFKGGDFVRVNPLRLKHDYLCELESTLVLFNASERGASGSVIESQTKNILTNKKSLEAMHTNRKLAKEIKYSLLRGDFDKFGELLHLGWESKKKISKKISTPFIDKAYEELKKVGALGGKITGAGGGGHVLFHCKPGHKLHVLKKGLELGLKEVPFTFDHQGLTTWIVIRSPAA